MDKALIGVGAALLCAWVAMAEVGQSLDFTDLRGRVYRGAQILRLEPGAVVVQTADGISRIPAEALPQDIRQRLTLPPAPAAGTAPGSDSGEPSVPGGQGGPSGPGFAMAGGALPRAEPEAQATATTEALKASVAEICQMAKSGSIGSAWMKLYDLTQRGVAWDKGNLAHNDQIIMAAIAIAKEAAARREVTEAKAALRLAMRLDPRSPRLHMAVNEWFRDVGECVDDGHFDKAVTLASMFDPGEWGEGLSVLKTARLAASDRAVTHGWHELMGLNVVGASSAREAAEGICPENPRIGALGAMLLVIQLGCLAGLVAATWMVLTLVRGRRGN